MHILAAIAFRDRLGKNGQGCWASYAKLAEDTNYDLTSVSKAQWESYGVDARGLAQSYGVDARQNKIWLSQSKKIRGNPRRLTASPALRTRIAETTGKRWRRISGRSRPLSETEHRPLTRGERQYFARHMRRCAEIADEILYCDDVDPAYQNLGFQAERLADQMADRVEGAAA